MEQNYEQKKNTLWSAQNCFGNKVKSEQYEWQEFAARHDFLGLKGQAE